MTTLGTWQWAQTTSGLITNADRAELGMRVGALLEAAARPAPATPLTLAFAESGAPDSALCRDATSLWHDVAPEWLVGHGYRTWHFARALQELDKLQVDSELLYVACLLHDLGLTEHAPPSQQVPCFAVSGARAAEPVVEQHRPSADAELVAEAIAMHLNIDVPLDAGELSYLVASATLVDVSGARLQLVPAVFVDAVLAAHPRGQFGEQVGEALSSVGEEFSRTRSGYMHEVLGVGHLCRQHPLDQSAANSSAG